MFLLYHSEGCNICELVLHECYINDLHTTTYSGMLGHHSQARVYDAAAIIQPTHQFLLEQTSSSIRVCVPDGAHVVTDPRGQAPTNHSILDRSNEMHSSTRKR
jgi:hypothetical protein